MRNLSRLLAFVAILAIASSTSLIAQQKINAVIPGDFADPSVIRVGNQYFAAGTSSEWAPHFPIYTSSNLKDWKQTGYIFDKAPEWTTGSFWAPEYYYHNKTYYIYYTARRKKDNLSFIGVATSQYPDRGFKDHGVLIEHTKEAIDAFVYNDNGQLYISYKAYGLDNTPIEIIGSKLSADGLKLEGELFTMFKDDSRMGLEGQSILKKDDYYYLFYSAGACCGSQCDYNVRIARSKHYKGPYEDYQKNPALAGNAEWKCSGHGTFVNTPEGRTFYLYHAYNRETTVYTGREGMLAELTWPEKNGWPVFTEEPNTAAKVHQVNDSFTAKIPAGYWQWDFRNSNPVAKQINGNLHLSGTVKAGNPSGIAYTVRPVSAEWEMSTTVVNHNTALKGLTYYGDANASLSLGVAGDRVEFWIVKDGKRQLAGYEALTSKTKPVHLKLVGQANHTCKIYWSQEPGKWKQMISEGNFSYDFLPQWDRSPRIGLNFKGETGQDARFSSFEVNYK
ncbi:MAG TPA: glycoside hydrolase family 43 protein [Pedobacter sp.]|nr:glycoside hydrolase family 43 protein [Pedobacter sp.]